MGTGKKEKSRKERQGKVGDGMNNVKTKGVGVSTLAMGQLRLTVDRKTSIGPRSKRKH